MELGGGTYRLGEDFKVILLGGARHNELGPFLWGIIPWHTKKRYSFGNWRRARMDEMIKKWSRESLYISCNYSCTISFLVKILLVKLKNFYIKYAWIFFLIGVHSMQGWTATTRHGITRKEAQKRLQDKENLFRKNLQLRDVC